MREALVVQLEASLVREIRSVLAGAQGYASIVEFLEVAAHNQVELERTRTTSSTDPQSSLSVRERPPTYRVAPAARALNQSADDSLLVRPPTSPPVELLPAAYVDGGELSSWTNRLSPVKVATRVLA